MYPQSYHSACNHLVSFGAWRYRIRGRRLLATALRDMRRTFGRTRAQQERRHMLFISGMFPARHNDRRYVNQSWAQPDEDDR